MFVVSKLTLLQIANMIRHLLKNYLKVNTSYTHGVCCGKVLRRLICCLCLQPIPAVLEVPSKDNPYDPNQDSILSRVQHMLGAQ